MLSGHKAEKCRGGGRTEKLAPHRCLHTFESNSLINIIIYLFLLFLLVIVVVIWLVILVLVFLFNLFYFIVSRIESRCES